MDTTCKGSPIAAALWLPCHGTRQQDRDPPTGPGARQRDNGNGTTGTGQRDNGTTGRPVPSPSSVQYHTIYILPCTITDHYRKVSAPSQSSTSSSQALPYCKYLQVLPRHWSQEIAPWCVTDVWWLLLTANIGDTWRLPLQLGLVCKKSATFHDVRQSVSIAFWQQTQRDWYDWPAWTLLRALPFL